MSEEDLIQIIKDVVDEMSDRQEIEPAGGEDEAEEEEIEVEDDMMEA